MTLGLRACLSSLMLTISSNTTDLCWLCDDQRRFILLQRPGLDSGFNQCMCCVWKWWCSCCWLGNIVIMHFTEPQNSLSQWRQLLLWKLCRMVIDKHKNCGRVFHVIRLSCLWQRRSTTQVLQTLRKIFSNGSFLLHSRYEHVLVVVGRNWWCFWNCFVDWGCLFGVGVIKPAAVTLAL